MDIKVVWKGPIYESNMMQTKFVHACVFKCVCMWTHCSERQKCVCERWNLGRVAVYLGVVILAWHLAPVWHCLFPSLPSVLCVCVTSCCTLLFSHFSLVRPRFSVFSSTSPALPESRCINDKTKRSTVFNDLIVTLLVKLHDHEVHVMDIINRAISIIWFNNPVSFCTTHLILFLLHFLHRSSMFTPPSILVTNNNHHV